MLIVLLKRRFNCIYLLVGTQFVGINPACMKLSLEQLEGNKEHLQRQHACPPLSHCSASKRGVFLFASNSCVNCCDDLCIGHWWQEKIGGSLHVTWTSIGNKIAIWGAVLSCHEGWGSWVPAYAWASKKGPILQLLARQACIAGLVCSFKVTIIPVSDVNRLQPTGMAFCTVASVFN